ncbi:unnamed protein product [Hermetia illucens]|uniref:Uncharacterized protein n=1 Tax=Hermetia illucens TaxID=343691 RepID=A0A7R8V760_HERIL|nr:unnamed protein product [Hermetia illucens]
MQAKSNLQLYAKASGDLCKKDVSHLSVFMEENITWPVVVAEAKLIELMFHPTFELLQNLNRFIRYHQSFRLRKDT